MVLGAPPFYPQKGQESPRKPPRATKRLLKATKKLQKATKKPETKDLPDPQVKMRFFLVLKSMVLGAPPFYPQKGQESPRKPPRATKKL